MAAKGAPIARPALVLTRPTDAARAVAFAVRGAGMAMPILFAPVLRITAIAPPDLPDGTLIFTSQHAVRRAAELGLAARRAVAVGDHTAQIARALGFDCRAGPGDVDGLARTLLADHSGPLLYLRGRHVTADLTAQLGAAGIPAASRIVYDQLEQSLTGAAIAALARPGTLLPLYSARSARLVADQIGPMTPAATVLAISQTVARAWPLPTPIHIADQPTAAAMLTLLRNLVASQGER